MNRLPPSSARFLQWALPRQSHDELIGDIEEEYRGVAESGRSRVYLFLWSWWATISLAGGFLARRVRVEFSIGRIAEGVKHDLRSGLRTFCRRPLFSLLLTATFALGVGANAVVFSIVKAVLLEPLPFFAPERLVSVGEVHRAWSTNQASASTFLDWRDHAASFESMAATLWWDANLEMEEQPQRIREARVTAAYFGVLGVRPALGRTFSAEECAPGHGNRVAVLGHSLWRRLGGNAGVLGQTVRVNGEDKVVVGVMPPMDYSGPFIGLGDIWTPLPLREAELRQQRDSWRGYRIIARLRDGATVQRARAELETIHSRLRSQFPAAYAGFGVFLEPLGDYVRGDVRPAFRVVTAAVAALLLIACANIGSLLATRALAREREVAVRAALGATGPRLLSQFFAESLIHSLAGAMCGIGAAKLLLPFATVMLSDRIPRIGEIVVDLDVLALTLGASVPVGLLAGLTPALGLCRRTGAAAMGERTGSSARGATRGRQVVAILQIAATIVLLVSAGLTVQSFEKLVSINTGLHAANALTFDVALPASRYLDPKKRHLFFRELMRKLEATPGVVAAGGNRYLPLRERQYTQPIFAEGRSIDPAQAPLVQYGGVTFRYFAAMRIPLVAGRLPTEKESWDEGGVVVINEALAKELFPGENPLGKRLRHSAKSPWLEIVGVVGDVRQRRLDTPAFPQIYVPYADFNHNIMTVVVRTAGEPMALLGSVRAITRSLDPNVPVHNEKPLEEALLESAGDRRIAAGLLQVFAALASLLAGIGIYGLMRTLVQQRSAEIGIRMALGAPRAALLRKMLGQALGLTMAGVTLGLVLSLALAHFLRPMLFGISVLDPGTWSAAVASILAIAAIASFVPVRRAIRADPLQALRGD